MDKFIIGKRIAAIEWFHVEAESKEQALETWNRGVGVEFRGQGDAEEFLDDMIVQEWDDKTEPSVLPPLLASAPRLQEQVRILREALNQFSGVPHVHNCALTTDIEALRSIVLGFAMVWNSAAIPALEATKPEGA